MVTVDKTLLEAALSGYERQREDLEAKIAEIRRHLGSAPVAVTSTESGSGKKRVINAAARKRMAAAQKKRWAAYRKVQGAPAKAPKAKRVLSAAAKRNIAEATRKRWAEYRAAKASKA
jgi:hypothetical protein